MSTPEIAAPDLTLSTGAATDQTIVVTGANAGTGINATWIALPGSGQLEVNYEFEDQPAATAMLWHYGGTFDPLLPSDHTYDSGPGDALSFSLVYETQSIKIGWSYV